MRTRLLGLDRRRRPGAWDNILDRHPGEKLPVVHAWGESNLNVATSLGRILRDRGIDTTARPTPRPATASRTRSALR
jgi:hypothetical protein